MIMPARFARYVHIATGYPAIQFLPDLQAYRDRTQDTKSVVNAYDNTSISTQLWLVRAGTNPAAGEMG